MTTPGELDPITGEPALDPTLLDEREPLPDGPLPDEAFMEWVPPAPDPPPAGQPEAERGISDGTLVCSVCLWPVARGEEYTKTLIRGFNHSEPCSHRS